MPEAGTDRHDVVADGNGLRRGEMVEGVQLRRTFAFWTVRIVTLEAARIGKWAPDQGVGRPRAELTIHRSWWWPRDNRGAVPPTNDRMEVPTIMRAFTPEVGDVVWAAFEPLIPVPIDTHPLGVHRRRKSDRDCFAVMLVRLVTGCSWEDAERLCGNKVSDTTVRSRRDEWIDNDRRAKALFAQMRELAAKATELILEEEPG